MRKPTTRKRNESFTLGFVTATCENSRWKFRWQDHTGKITRRIMPVADITEALELAKSYNIDIAAGRNIPGMRRLKAGKSVREAITWWLEQQTEQKDKTVSEYRIALNLFGVWLAENYPGVTHWEHLGPDHAKQYIQAVEGSWSTRKRRLVVLRMVSADLNRHDAELYRDFVKGAGIKLKQPPRQDKVHPSDRQLYHLFAWFRRRYPALWAQLVLEAFAGVRGFEACFLRNCDLDMAEGTIAIVPTEAYQLKNPGSKRTIPVCQIVLASLAEYRRRSVVQSLSDDGPFFLNHYGEAWTESGICTSRSKAMTAYKRYLAENRLPALPGGFMLRELRSVFSTAAVRADVSEAMLQRYIGHSSRTVVGRHYVRLTTQDLRRGVVDKLEAVFKAAIEHRKRA